MWSDMGILIWGRAEDFLLTQAVLCLMVCLVFGIALLVLALYYDSRDRYMASVGSHGAQVSGIRKHRSYGPSASHRSLPPHSMKASASVHSSGTRKDLRDPSV